MSEQNITLGDQPQGRRTRSRVGTDDVEGHRFLALPVSDSDTSGGDVEGHRVRTILIEQDSFDRPSVRSRQFKLVIAGPDDVVDGHALRVLVPEDDADEVEGSVVRLPDPDDVEGHHLRAIVDTDVDDVTAHCVIGYLVPVSGGATDEYRGYARRPSAAPRDAEDDVQGHILPGKTIPSVGSDDHLFEHPRM